MNKRIILLGIIGIFCAVNAATEDAVTAFTNGTFYTSNVQAPSASAVVVKGDKIAFVGTDSGALTFAGPDARTIDLGSIEVGKQADLVVLNQNLFDVNRYDVHKTKPVAVIIDGELVHGEL